jgi:hypothetical protein
VLVSANVSYPHKLLKECTPVSKGVLIVKRPLDKVSANLKFEFRCSFVLTVMQRSSARERDFRLLRPPRDIAAAKRAVEMT